jgi:HEAT repeat protein
MRTAILAAAVVVGLAASRPAGSEPPAEPASATYADRPASWWVSELGSNPGRPVAEAVLAMMGADAAPALAEGLQGGSPQVRKAVTQLLPGQSWDLSPLGPALVVALEDADPEVRTQAFGALAKVRTLPAIPRSALQRFLGPGPTAPGSWPAALDLVARLGPQGAVFAPDVASLVSASNDSIRLRAISVLGALGPAGAPGVDALLAAAKENDPSTRRHALDALSRIAPARTDVLALATEDLERREAASSQVALEAWIRCLNANPAALEGLLARLSHADRGVRQLAVTAAGRLDPSRPEAAVPVARLLEDPAMEVRVAARTTLEKMGDAARAAVPVVLEIEKDSEALKRLTSRFPVAVADALEGAPPDRRRAAVRVLLAVPSHAYSDSVETIAVAVGPVVVDEAEPTARRDEAARLLARAADASEKAFSTALSAIVAWIAAAPPPDGTWDDDPMTTLKAWARDEGGVRVLWPRVTAEVARNPRVHRDRRQSAVGMLASMPGPGGAPTAALLALLTDPDPDLALSASLALRPRVAAIPEVLRVLESDREAVRLLALQAIDPAHLTEEQREAVSRRLEDPSPRVAGATAIALLGARGVGSPQEWPPPRRASMVRAIGLALDDPVAQTRLNAVFALDAHPRVAAEVLPALRRRLDDPDPAVARFAGTVVEKAEVEAAVPGRPGR